MTTPRNDDEPQLETDDRFPSGPWQGYFLQPGFSEQFRMELSLEFQDGRMFGDGVDYVGPFVIQGRYDLEDGKCSWTKQYLHRHAVYYAGYNEGKGIWGMWDIPQVWTGGFHIWPEGMADGYAKQESQTAERPRDMNFTLPDSKSVEPSTITRQ